jgi:hypothetical protein
MLGGTGTTIRSSCFKESSQMLGIGTLKMMTTGMMVIMVDTSEMDVCVDPQHEPFLCEMTEK